MKSSLLFFAVVTAVVAAAFALTDTPTPVPIPRSCSAPDAQSKFVYCNTSLSFEQRVTSLIANLLPDEKSVLLTARASPLGAVPRLNLSAYDWGLNCIHGVQSRCGKRSDGTVNCPVSFPNPVNLGASFNMSLVKQMGAVIGVEARSLWLQGVGENHGNDLPHMGLDFWSPNININRDPRWGRNQEVPGEDPKLTGDYGVAYTQGTQYGEDKKYLMGVTTLKHWAAYSLEDFGDYSRHNFTANVTAYDLADVYLPAFKRAVMEAGAAGVMCSYNAISVEGSKSTPTCASSFLRDILRTAWNFNGYVTSDSGAVVNIYRDHHYVATEEEAACVAIRDGRTDINSGPVYQNHLTNATDLGLCSQSDVDLAMRGSLMTRFRLGLMDPIEDQPYWHVSPDAVNTPANQDFNLFATEKTMTLLKNDGLLPLSPGKKVAVIGPHANATAALVGNYLGQICPDDGFDCIVSPFLAIQALNSGGETTMSEGCDVRCESDSGFAAAVEAAKAADVIVLAIGIGEEIEGESHDRTYVDLPGLQSNLSTAIHALGKPVAVVLVNGGMVSVPFEKDHSNAILESYYPGYAGGTAIGRTLFGLNNPGGRLPYTVYQPDIVNQVDMYDMSFTNGPGRSYRFFTGEPLWPFGYGLSYTTFTLEWASGSAPMPVTVPSNITFGTQYQVKVTNTGPVVGDEVIMAKFKPHGTSLKDLKLLQQMFAYERVTLEPGASTTITFTVDNKALTMANPENGDMVLAAGGFTLEFTNGVANSLTASYGLNPPAITVVEPFPVPLPSSKN